MGTSLSLLLPISGWSPLLQPSLVLLKTQMLFVASGKPSGAVVFVVVVGILIPDRSLSSAVVLFSVRRRLCHSNAFCITLISIYGMRNAVRYIHTRYATYFLSVWGSLKLAPISHTCLYIATTGQTNSHFVDEEVVFL